MFFEFLYFRKRHSNFSFIFESIKSFAMKKIWLSILLSLFLFTVSIAQNDAKMNAFVKDLMNKMTLDETSLHQVALLPVQLLAVMWIIRSATGR